MGGMTAKHYEIIARALRMARGVYDGEPQALEALAYLEGVLIEEFKVENPRFNEEKFGRRCRTTEGSTL